MNRLLGILALVAAIALPAIAQVQKMTSGDEAKFNGYYQRWVEDRQNNDRDDMVDMEHHMQDIMNKYAIPPDTPYDQVFLRIRRSIKSRPWRDTVVILMLVNTRAASRRTIRNTSIRLMSHWQSDRAKRDQDDIAKDEGKMQEIHGEIQHPARRAV